MAKRDPHCPALRGDQVQRWLQAGILKADQLGDTPILVVREAVRVRLTKGHRTTLGQGIFLVPRWVEIPWRRWTAGLHDLSAEELEARAIIVRPGGRPYRLIFQQVEDLDHLCRQQRHVLKQGEDNPYFERRIKPYIIARRQAADSLRRIRKRRLEAIRNGWIAPVGKKLHYPELMTPEAVAEAVARLDEAIAALDEIVERPLVIRRKRAQRSLRAAQRWIQERDFARTLRHLRAAWKNLMWPTP